MKIKELRKALADFIRRVADGDTVNDNETVILPQIVDIYISEYQRKSD